VLAGVARNAREEQLAARNRRMAELYRRHVLKEEGLIQISKKWEVGSKK
jgi:hypothetical protein